MSTFFLCSHFIDMVTSALEFTLPFCQALRLSRSAHVLSSPQQCCDLGYHASLNRALRTFLSAELNLEQSKHEGLDAIENAVENLDATSDKQRLMEMYNNVFCPPMKFEFQPHMGDMVRLSSPHLLESRFTTLKPPHYSGESKAWPSCQVSEAHSTHSTNSY